MHRLADHNEDYAPFQIDWGGSKPNSYNAKAVFVAAQSPLGTGETLSFGYNLRDASRIHS